MFVCYSVFKTYVIEKICLYGIMSLTPMFLCLTQKPHPVRLGWGCVPRERENQINTLVLKDINFTINIIDCLITERLIPWINLKCSRGKSLPKPLRRRGCPYCIQVEITKYMWADLGTSPPLEGLGEAFLGGAFTLPVVQCGLHSPRLLERGRGWGFFPLLLSSSTIRRSLQPTLASIPFPAWRPHEA